MGYRSVGKLYLTPKVYDMLTEEMKNLLDVEWEKETTSFENDGCEIYGFEGWKWYTTYPEVSIWTNFFNELEDDEDVSEDDWDFIVIGEDNAIIEHRTQTHFAVSSNIEVF
jgi:hypothetical protein